MVKTPFLAVISSSRSCRDSSSLVNSLVNTTSPSPSYSLTTSNSASSRTNPINAVLCTAETKTNAASSVPLLPPSHSNPAVTDVNTVSTTSVTSKKTPFIVPGNNRSHPTLQQSSGSHTQREGPENEIRQDLTAPPLPLQIQGEHNLKKPDTNTSFVAQRPPTHLPSQTSISSSSSSQQSNSSTTSTSASVVVTQSKSTITAHGTEETMSLAQQQQQQQKATTVASTIPPLNGLAHSSLAAASCGATLLPSTTTAKASVCAENNTVPVVGMTPPVLSSSKKTPFRPSKVNTTTTASRNNQMASALQPLEQPSCHIRMQPQSASTGGCSGVIMHDPSSAPSAVVKPANTISPDSSSFAGRVTRSFGSASGGGLAASGLPNNKRTRDNDEEVGNAANTHTGYSSSNASNGSISGANRVGVPQPHRSQTFPPLPIPTVGSRDADDDNRAVTAKLTCNRNRLCSTCTAGTTPTPNSIDNSNLWPIIPSQQPTASYHTNTNPDKNDPHVGENSRAADNEAAAKLASEAAAANDEIRELRQRLRQEQELRQRQERELQQRVQELQQGRDREQQLELQVQQQQQQRDTTFVVEEEESDSDGNGEYYEFVTEEDEDNNVPATQQGDDHRLVIMGCKRMERMLDNILRDRGLTPATYRPTFAMKLDAAEPVLADWVIRRMRRLSHIRNSVCHEADYDSVPDREDWTEKYESVLAELQDVLDDY